jgi:hypothetical protein
MEGQRGEGGEAIAQTETSTRTRERRRGQCGEDGLQRASSLSAGWVGREGPGERGESEQRTEKATTDKIRLEPVETRGEEGRPAEQICVMKHGRVHAWLDDSHGVDDEFLEGLMNS